MCVPVQVEKQVERLAFAQMVATEVQVPVTPGCGCAAAPSACGLRSERLRLWEAAAEDVAAAAKHPRR